MDSQQQGEPSKVQARQAKPVDNANAENRMLFFAKVLRSATDDEVRNLFSRFGKVHEVNLFRAFQGAPTTKGCGLVTMGTHEEAVAAIEGLDSKYMWEGMDSAMVIKWMDVAMQRRRREQHLAAVRQGLVPNYAVSQDWRVPLMPGGYVLTSIPTHGVGIPAAAASILPHETERPPVGCDPDAIKLFVGNLPRSCSEQQLLQLFGTVGKVVELVIVRDKATQEPKGSAFVWYASRAFAERAILQFNLRHCLPDPVGEQDRPLVVRKAKARATAVHPAIGMLTGNAVPQQLADLSMAPMGLLPGQGQMALQYNHHVGPMAMGPLMASHGLEGMPMQANPHVAMVNPMAYKGTAMPGGGALMGGPGMPNTSMADGGVYDYEVARHRAGAGPGDPGDGAYMVPSGSGPGLDALPQVVVSIPVNQQQMAMVNQYLYSAQAMSGAQLSITPGAPGLFHLVVSGNVAQVDSARGLLTSLLNVGQ